MTEKKINNKKLSQEDREIIELCQPMYDKTIEVFNRTLDEGVIQDYISDPEKGKQRTNAITQEVMKDIDTVFALQFAKAMQKNMIQVKGKAELKEGPLKTSLSSFITQFDAKKTSLSIMEIKNMRNEKLAQLDSKEDKIAFVTMTNIAIAHLDAAQQYQQRHYLGRSEIKISQDNLKNQPHYFASYDNRSLNASPVYAYNSSIKSKLVYNYRPVLLQIGRRQEPASILQQEYSAIRGYGRSSNPLYQAYGYMRFSTSRLFNQNRAWLAGVSGMSLGIIGGLAFAPPSTPVTAMSGLTIGYFSSMGNQYANIATDTANNYQNSIHYRERMSGGASSGSKYDIPKPRYAQ